MPLSAGEILQTINVTEYQIMYRFKLPSIPCLPFQVLSLLLTNPATWVEARFCVPLGHSISQRASYLPLEYLSWVLVKVQLYLSLPTVLIPTLFQTQQPQPEHCTVCTSATSP